MSTTPKRRRLPPEQRRAQLLDAAGDLFAERGYEEVSVEDIARAADVQRGLVHHYFGGRKDVYLALVERLALHRGRVLSRTELYAHLFDEDDDSFSNLLDVHVSNVRKKLGKEFIQTRRGFGYVIDA